MSGHENARLTNEFEIAEAKPTPSQRSRAKVIAAIIIILLVIVVLFVIIFMLMKHVDFTAAGKKNQNGESDEIEVNVVASSSEEGNTSIQFVAITSSPNRSTVTTTRQTIASATQNIFKETNPTTEVTRRKTTATTRTTTMRKTTRISMTTTTTTTTRHTTTTPKITTTSTKTTKKVDLDAIKLGDLIYNEALANTPNLTLIESYLKQGANITHLSSDDYEHTVMFEAIRINNYNLMRLLIEYDPSIVNTARSDKTYPIHSAAEMKNLDAIRILVENGANIDQKLASEANKTALTIAAGCGYLELIEYLVDKGANVKQTFGENGIERTNQEILCNSRSCAEERSCSTDLKRMRLLLTSGEKRRRLRLS